MLSGRIFFLLVTILFAAPLSVFAKDKQADAQCQSGGVVGQPCKDNTNGYQTTGHCTHINICAADNWPKAPRGCQPGQVVGTDCPYPKNAPISGFGTPGGIIATSTTISGFGDTDMEALFAAYGNIDESGNIIAPDVVGSTSIDGIEYLVTAANEALQVGEPLTPVPVVVANTGNLYDLDGPPPQAVDHELASINPYQLVPGNASGGVYGAGSFDRTQATRGAYRASFFGFQAPSSFQNGASTTAQQSLFSYIIELIQSAFRSLLRSDAARI